MTKEEFVFIYGFLYHNMSENGKERLKHLTPVACECGEEGCEGWKMILGQEGAEESED